MGQGHASHLSGAQGVLRGHRRRRAGPGDAPARRRRGCGAGADRPRAERPRPAGVTSLNVAALEVEGLTRRYGERDALHDVSLTLEEGRTLVVFGPNGAGKTTLLRVLASLLRPHEGNVRVLGASLPREAFSLRGRVGLLGHEPLLYRELTARENLRFQARLHGVREERVGELLEAVEIAHRRDEPLRALSRGMV